ncbi:hypothetical protein Bca4012_009443 [Brassica carinata]|uniref:Uncharacterized protein n=1 Tax=Brassica carinata TaxID=52824 RepID=A0A8X7S212_BRACI|nr:hypothetical protein Bca52824_034714 [Brassica carinata]
MSSELENCKTRGDEHSFGVGSWRVKKWVWSLMKRVRSNWVLIIGQTDHGGKELKGGFKDFSREDSKSPIKDESLMRDGGEFYDSTGNGEFELSEPSNMDSVGEGIKGILLLEGLSRSV